MILQFPLGDLRSDAQWREKISEIPFGPQEGPPGFSSHLALTLLAGLTGDLVAPFDGFLRRILDEEVPQGEDPPPGPAVFEIQPLVNPTTLHLADGLEGQMPRLRWHNLDPNSLHPEITRDDPQDPGQILSQLTATDSNQQAHRIDRFLAGDSSIFVERGMPIAAGVGVAEFEILTREGVSVDPLGYYSHYLAIPSGPDDFLAEREWLEALSAVLTRRALVQLVDEHGAPVSSVTVRRPGVMAPEVVDTTASQGTLVWADFPAGGGIEARLESVEVPEPTPDASEQSAERYQLLSPWPSGAEFPVGPVALDPPAIPVFRRFVVTHLRDWLTSQYVTDETIRLPRYTLSNLAETLVDGNITFKRMYDDIKAIPADGLSRFYYLSAWGLSRDVKLNLDDEDSGFQDLMEALVENGTAVRLMLWDQLHQDSDQLQETLTIGLTVLAGLSIAAMGLIPPAAWIGFSIFSATLVGMAALPANPDLLSALVDANEEHVQELNDAGVPAFLDGKVRETRTSGLTRLYDFIGSHHQKVSVISGPGGTAAYLGGIDINSNRVDDPGHYKRSPYHDTHCRVIGPAAADVVTTLRQRWDDQHPDDPANDGLPVADPLPGATHVIQIARTYPNKINEANEAYPFAPEGDFTILNTIKQAIQQARRYIYLEDQYLTPPEDIQELLRIQLTDNPELRLVMVIPRSSDQPQGTQHRAQFIGSLLSLPGVDVERVAVLFPTKLVFPHDTERHGPIITRLSAEISDSDIEIVVGDPSRFADKGIVLIDEEEIKYSSRNLPDRKLVLSSIHGRGYNNTVPAPHTARSLVRQVEYRDIFVHSKLWIIDDIFACIGSANMNERSMTHDSELSAFIIDGFTDRSARRFAKDLRIQLWSDHLGLAGSAAARLLLDNPDEALDFLLKHPGPAGNHLRRYWHTWNAEMVTESWNSLLDPGFYWDMLPIITDDIWDTYVDPSGRDPF